MKDEDYNKVVGCMADIKFEAPGKFAMGYITQENDYFDQMKKIAEMFANLVQSQKGTWLDASIQFHVDDNGVVDKVSELKIVRNPDVQE